MSDTRKKLLDLDIVFSENSNAMIVTELGQGDQGAGSLIIKLESRLGHVAERR